MWSPRFIAFMALFSATIITLLFTSVSAIQAFTNKKMRFFLYVAVSLIFHVMFSILVLLSQVFLSPLLFILAIYSLIPMGFFAILLFDELNRDTLDARKVALYIGSVMPLVIYSLIKPDVVLIAQLGSGDIGIMLDPTFVILLILFLVIVSQLYLYYHVKVFFKAPREKRKLTACVLAGAFLFAIVGPAVSLLFLPSFFKGNYQAAVSSFTICSFGVIMSTACFVKDPQLVNTLLFEKIILLTVFDTEIGVMVYNHTWNNKKDMINNELFSAMMQGIGLIVDEAIKQGTLEELKVTNATVIVRRVKDNPIAVALVASKPSRALRRALALFSQRFINQYKDDFQAPYEICKFENSIELIQECFPSIP